MAIKRGQALMELAVGMLALALVVTLLASFAVYIAKSLHAQNHLRHGSGGSSTKTDTVVVGDFAAKYFFGKDTLKIRERVEMPTTAIVK